MQVSTSSAVRRGNPLLGPLLVLLLVPTLAVSGLPVLAPLGKAATAVLTVDLLSGALHWLEDSYGNPEWPITGRFVTRPNQEHHRDPRAMAKHTWWDSAAVPLAIGVLALAATWALGVLSWPVALALGVGVNANEIHKWAHRTRSENGPVVNLLHRLRILQTARHHGLHHGRAKDTHYCVVTNVLNPVLDRVGLWRGLERGLERAFGWRPRPDPTVPLALRRPA